jgi:hypothetical protein
MVHRRVDGCEGPKRCRKPETICASVSRSSAENGSSSTSSPGVSGLEAARDAEAPLADLRLQAGGKGAQVLTEGGAGDGHVQDRPIAGGIGPVVAGPTQGHRAEDDVVTDQRLRSSSKPLQSWEGMVASLETELPLEVVDTQLPIIAFPLQHTESD